MRKLVLWGHHVKEYEAMFALSGAEMHGRILEFGCGASAVNAELVGQAARVVSVDPLFSLAPEPLRHAVLSAFDARAAQVMTEPTQFDVSEYGTIDALIAERRAGVECFLADFAVGRQTQRYRPLTEVSLPFAATEFDWALSSHFLFAEAAPESVAWHVKTIGELARVAHEVRIFPLIERAGEASPLLGPVLLGLQQANFGVEVRQVAYSLYPQGNAMLRVWAKQCAV